MVRAKLTDQCLWLKHVEGGPIKSALKSIHPGSTITLLIDGLQIDFQRMATGRDGRLTEGFNPVGPNAASWRARYLPGRHEEIEIEFAETVGA